MTELDEMKVRVLMGVNHCSREVAIAELALKANPEKHTSDEAPKSKKGLTRIFRGHRKARMMSAKEFFADVSDEI